MHRLLDVRLEAILEIALEDHIVDLRLVAMLEITPIAVLEIALALHVLDLGLVATLEIVVNDVLEIALELALDLGPVGLGLLILAVLLLEISLCFLIRDLILL